MFEIEVIRNDESVKVLRFDEFTRKVVTHKYNQLVSEGSIKGWKFI
jgi:hypothetical protein